jgi:hypothetical protein
MALECGCGDFDKGELDRWWEVGAETVPPDGAKCCECGAPLHQEPCATLLDCEVYDPEDPEPDIALFCSIDDYYEALERYQSAHGW